MNAIHSSPFKIEFDTYLGKFSLLMAKHEHYEVQTKQLSTHKNLSYTEEDFSTFDFHQLLLICNEVYGSMPLHAYNSTVVTLPCDVKMGTVDGNDLPLARQLDVQLCFVKSGHMEYSAEILFPQRFTISSGSYTSVVSIRLIREGESVVAYVTTSDIQRQFTYGRIITETMEVGTTFFPTRTIRLVKDVDRTAMVVADVPAIYAGTLLVNKLKPLAHRASAENPVWRGQVWVLSDILSMKHYTLDEKVTPELERLLTSFYVDYIVYKKEGSNNPTAEANLGHCLNAIIGVYKKLLGLRD